MKIGKRVGWGLFFLLAAVDFLPAQDVDSKVLRDERFNGVILVKQYKNYPFLLGLPDGYANSKNPWPMILFLHGAGDRGNDITQVQKSVPFQYMENRFAVVAPQCPLGQHWSSETLNNLLEQVLSRYAIDRRRIYLTGISMGGTGTWYLACFSPGRFAAIAPLCGGGDPNAAYRLLKVPTWAFHGLKDNVIPIRESARMVEALEKAGGDVKLTVYKNAGHGIYDQTYSNPELYTWFLAHQR